MSTTPQPADQAEQAIVIDGDTYTLDDLTFREQHALRSAVRELSGDPEMTVGEAPLMDFLPALAYVIKRRAEPAYTVEQALDLRTDQVLADLPPTKPASAKPRAARAGTGSRATS
jgi:hypothetical protein